ncbi:GtrA family protein [Tardiphaga sp. 839_C3_N1_4]|uniref:GtrA family protein n=1 Tax=Tardiphaga sp. 839_C3_N1_4 TaxID=3240761 RepID=UPI003F1EBE52
MSDLGPGESALSRAFKAFVADDGARLQAVRFVIVGLKSNAVYYLLYVLLALAGVGPKTAVVIVFVFGMVYAFWFNKAFVFRDRDHLNWQFVRYMGVYIFALALNLVLLEWVTTYLGFSHFLVQAVLGVVIAIPIFFLLKYFVFPSKEQGAVGP